MRTKKYRFIADSGHAWLEVPIEELKTLGIADKISTYSYMNNGMAYLEEDCDAPVFAAAKKWEKWQGNIREIYQNKCRIRNYRSYFVN